jgi:hypothetical protein
MPADWISFITNVSNKLDVQSVQGSYDSGGRNIDDFATYPYNNKQTLLHVKPSTSVDQHR